MVNRLPVTIKWLPDNGSCYHLRAVKAIGFVRAPFTAAEDPSQLRSG
jgi:hypothetical protein